jgi:hypothetical protein
MRLDNFRGEAQPSHLLKTGPAELEHLGPFNASTRLESSGVRGAFYGGLAVFIASSGRYRLSSRNG